MSNKTDWNDVESNIYDDNIYDDNIYDDNIYDDKILKNYISRISICLYMILPLLGVFLIVPPFSRIYIIIMIVVVIAFTIWNINALEKRTKQLLEEQVKEYYKSGPSDP